MARPQDDRIVHEPPLFTEFKPVGVRGHDLEGIQLTLDELEAIRLADQHGLSHEEAAGEMEISRSTFSRLIEKARRKTAEFFIQGKLLTIEGGSVHFKNNIIRCQNCEHMFKIGINNNITECPACHSKNLINMAGGFGHGRCCHSEHRKHRK